MVFEDEFNGSRLDTSKWNTQFWYRATDGGAYMSASNITESHGYLDLRVLHQSAGSSANGTAEPYSGSMANTYGKFRYTYGAIEIRAKVAGGGGGLDNGIFLLNDSGHGRDVWPPEIDLVEVRSGESTMASMTYHWKQSGAHKASAYWFKGAGDDFAKSYHTFTMDWERGYIRWYIDGVLRASYTNSGEITSLPMYIIMEPGVCTATSGWCTRPTSNSMFPAHLSIDYVRVWQH